jgi:hypothetical protein
MALSSDDRLAMTAFLENIHSHKDDSKGERSAIFDNAYFALSFGCKYILIMFALVDGFESFFGCSGMDMLCVTAVGYLTSVVRYRRTHVYDDDGSAVDVKGWFVEDTGFFDNEIDAVFNFLCRFIPGLLISDVAAWLKQPSSSSAITFVLVHCFIAKESDAEPDLMYDFDFLTDDEEERECDSNMRLMNGCGKKALVSAIVDLHASRVDELIVKLDNNAPEVAGMVNDIRMEMCIRTLHKYRIKITSEKSNVLHPLMGALSTPLMFYLRHVSRHFNVSMNHVVHILEHSPYRIGMLKVFEQIKASDDGFYLAQHPEVENELLYDGKFIPNVTYNKREIVSGIRDSCAVTNSVGVAVAKSKKLFSHVTDIGVGHTSGATLGTYLHESSLPCDVMHAMLTFETSRVCCNSSDAMNRYIRRLAVDANTTSSALAELRAIFIFAIARSVKVETKVPAMRYSCPAFLYDDLSVGSEPVTYRSYAALCYDLVLTQVGLKIDPAKIVVADLSVSEILAILNALCLHYPCLLVFDMRGDDEDDRQFIQEKGELDTHIFENIFRFGGLVTNPSYL